MPGMGKSNCWYGERGSLGVTPAVEDGKARLLRRLMQATTQMSSGVPHGRYPRCNHELPGQVDSSRARSSIPNLQHTRDACDLVAKREAATVEGIGWKHIHTTSAEAVSRLELQTSCWLPFESESELRLA